MKILLPALPVILGFLLDCAVGDPYNIPHPIKLIGRLIGTLEKLVRKRMKNLRLGGVILGMTVILMSTAVPPCTAAGLLPFQPYRRHCS